MSAPKPPVALKNHCSIIHNGVIYVYSPDAFQTLELKEGTKWKQETNGVSVTGAVCVKGGVDGDNSKAALYVVGGATNASTPDYSGLQRYSIEDKSWQTVVPVVNVTENRLYHGAAYMNTSSTLVVYGGSQNDHDGPSSETFTIGLYPPYTVLAYSSTVPPTVSPFMLPWTQDRTLMVGGGPFNDKTSIFDPINGWQDLGLSLPGPLPDHSVAQCALFALADGSMVLETFNLGKSPATVSTNVLLNAGGAPATFGETAGSSATTASSSSTPTASSKSKRQTSLNTFPTYNDTLAPSGTRKDFNLAQGDDGLVALIGGNDDSPLLFYNQSGNGWIDASQFFGTPQVPLATSSSSPRSTSSSTSTPTASATPAAASSGHKTQGLTILGAVLGAICGVLAILLLVLLYVRSVRRKRRSELEKQEEYPDDKKRGGEYNYEERGLRPLALAGQAMGRSPVASAYVPEADTTAMFPGLRPDTGSLIRRVSSDRIGQAGYRGSGIGFGQALFKREKEKEKEKSSLTISKPMMPVLNDYQPRPSIELGKATPPSAPRPAVVSPKAAAVARKPSQRKTDEGWGKYFQTERLSGNRTTFLSRSSGQKSGFWPGSGNPENSTRSPKFMLRDSVGNPLDAQHVAAASPSLEHGPTNPQSRELQAAQGVAGHISRASSTRTDTTDDDYEDDRIVEAAFSSGIPASVQEMAWAPVGNTWSGPAQRPLHPPSSYVAAAQAQQGLGLPQAPPLQTASSNGTSNTSGTEMSSIPSFPMPDSIRSIRSTETGPNNNPRTFYSQVTRPPQTEPVGDYFTQLPRAHTRTPSNAVQQPGNAGHINTNMSWLNLGTPR